MKDDIGIAQDGRKGFIVADISRDKPSPRVQIIRLRPAGSMNLGVKTVVDDDLVALCDEGVHDMGADESGAAGYKDSFGHDVTVPPCAGMASACDGRKDARSAISMLTNQRMARSKNIFNLVNVLS